MNSLVLLSPNSLYKSLMNDWMPLSLATGEVVPQAVNSNVQYSLQFEGTNK